MSSDKDTGRTKIEIIQEQIDTTKGELQKNIQGLAKRGENLDVLGEKSAALSDSASKFVKQSSKVRKSMWWKSTKMTIILAVTIIIILAAIIVPTVLKSEGKI